MPTAYLPEQLLILLMLLKAYPAKIDILSRNVANQRRDLSRTLDLFADHLSLSYQAEFPGLLPVSLPRIKLGWSQTVTCHVALM